MIKIIFPTEKNFFSGCSPSFLHPAARWPQPRIQLQQEAARLPLYFPRASDFLPTLRWRGKLVQLDLFLRSWRRFTSHPKGFIGSFVFKIRRS